MIRTHLDRGKVHALAFSPDGRTLAVAVGRHAALLDVRTGSVVRWLIRPPPHDARTPVGLLFSADGRVLSIPNRLRDATAFDLRTDNPPTTVRPASPGRPRVYWASEPFVPILGTDPPLAWAVGYGELFRVPGRLFLVPLAGGRILAEVIPDRPRPTASWRTPDGRLVAWGPVEVTVFAPPDTPAVLTEWRLNPFVTTPGVSRLAVVDDFPLPTTATQAAAPLPDGETVLLAADRDVILWHPAGERVRWRWPPIQHPRAVAVSPDGLLAAAGDAQGRLVVWDLD